MTTIFANRINWQPPETTPPPDLGQTRPLECRNRLGQFSLPKFSRLKFPQPACQTNYAATNVAAVIHNCG
jgi:hypothetical protein